MEFTGLPEKRRLKEIFKAAHPITLEEVLDARENRAAVQQNILREFPDGALISFTMNIPGMYKNYSLVTMAFEEGIARLESQLSRVGATILYRRKELANTGCEWYCMVNMQALHLKKLTVALEDGHPLGRLFDMDVLDIHGSAVRGTQAGRKERTCLICESPVWACSRNRTHSAEELAVRTAEMLLAYFDARFADYTSCLATKALLYEVSATPKPGLVDRANNGAHKDMDIFTFLSSSTALTPYFRDITLQAILFEGAPEEMLAALRYTGQRAEEDMFLATGGANTHKGLIFSLGLICAAMGYAYTHELPQTPAQILILCGKIATATTRELMQASEKDQKTHGERVFAQFGTTGARGEAAAGFPHVRDYGLPLLTQMVIEGCSLNDAGCIVLLHFIAHVEDTNLLTRSNPQTIDTIKRELLTFLKQTREPALLLDIAQKLDEQFIALNISPGGCADLLAVSYMLYFIMQTPFEL